jgi:DNA-nicking Smr family endonuclease
MSGNKKTTFSIRPFDKLRKTMEQREAAAAPPPLRQKKKEDFTDEELFSREMGGVLVIEEFRSLACASRPRNRSAAPVHRDPEQEALAELSSITDGLLPIHLPNTQEYVEWIHPEFRDDIIQSLHEGRFSVQAYLDLHGCSVPEAEKEFDDFIIDSLKKGLSCIKIIHGRGLRSAKGARLKTAVVKRLSGHFRRDIIAYVTARQCDGGLGALYVLLRKKYAP